MTRAAALGFIAAFGVTVLSGGCRSTVVPVVPVRETGPGAAWRALQDNRAEPGGLRSQATIQFREGGRMRTVRATMALDITRQRFLLNVFSPIGTTVLTAYAGEGRVICVDRSNRVWWVVEERPSSETESGGTPYIPVALLKNGAALIFGLPAEHSSGVPAIGDASHFESAAWAYEVSSTGLAAASSRSNDRSRVSVTYAPPSFPPGRVAIVIGEPVDQTIAVTHDEIVRDPGSIEPLEVDPSYRQVYR